MNDRINPAPEVIREDSDTVTVISEHDRRAEHQELAQTALDAASVTLDRESEWTTDRYRRAVSTTWTRGADVDPATRDPYAYPDV